MHIELQRVAPAEIEARSMEIIRSELKRPLPPENEAVILRAIHTTADFDYAENLCFSPEAVARGVEALRSGAHIVTDTTMAMSGINKRVLAKFGGEVHNFIADPEVAAQAKERGVTRATISMERAAAMGKSLVYAIGNAPTALVRLYELWQEGTLPAPDRGRACGLRQCGGGQGVDHGDGLPLDRGPGPQGRQQCGRRHLQCPAVHRIAERKRVSL